jgi:hypothetical protein
MSDRDRRRLLIMLDATAKGAFAPVPVDAGIRAAKTAGRRAYRR